tara:strand:+ start:575 stop:1492 length:918 start_codon:yes stop_codon:yes gene_type:complete
MPALELLEDRAAPVIYFPTSLSSRPASATLVFKDPSGSTKETPSVTISTVGAGGSASVQSVQSQTHVHITAEDATGFIPGQPVWAETEDGWKGSLMVDEVDGVNVYFESAPPGTLTTGTLIYGLGLNASVTAAGTADRGQWYRLEWTITGADATVSVLREVAHVVRTQFADPIDPAGTEVKRYVAANWPGMAQSKTAGWFRSIAYRANARVRTLIQSNGDFPYLIGSPDVFVDSGAGLSAVRIELAHQSLVPGDYEIASYVELTTGELLRAVREAMANTYVDRGDTDSVDPGDIRQLAIIPSGRT